MSVTAQQYYQRALGLCEKLFDGEIDQAAFEEATRSLFATQGFMLFSIDKLLNMVLKQVRFAAIPFVFSLSRRKEWLTLPPAPATPRSRSVKAPCKTPKRATSSNSCGKIVRTRIVPPNSSKPSTARKRNLRSDPTRTCTASSGCPRASNCRCSCWARIPSHPRSSSWPRGSGRATLPTTSWPTRRRGCSSVRLGSLTSLGESPCPAATFYPSGGREKRADPLARFGRNLRKASPSGTGSFPPSLVVKSALQSRICMRSYRLFFTAKTVRRSLSLSPRSRRLTLPFPVPSTGGRTRPARFRHPINPLPHLFALGQTRPL